MLTRALSYTLTALFALLVWSLMNGPSTGAFVGAAIALALLLVGSAFRRMRVRRLQ